MSTYLLVKDEAAQQRSALLGGEVVKHAVKDHLCQQELVTRADLAGDSSLLLDDVLVRGESEPAQRPLAALELIEVHD